MVLEAMLGVAAAAAVVGVAIGVGVGWYLKSGMMCCNYCKNSGAFGGNRGLRPVPPEKGVFPLDHMHECDVEKKDYLSCLKSSSHQSEKCRNFSKKYLECRMAKNLMARQDMSELGFGKEAEAEAPAENESKRIDG